jgi:hypothetical protein
MADTIKISNNQDAIYVEVDSIPAGWSNDGIFYKTTGGKNYKIANDGNIRALNAGVLANGTDQTSRINTILSNAKVRVLIFDAYNSSITISGTVTVPTGKIVVFANDCKIIGSGTWTGGIVVCDVQKQCFATSLTITGLENKEVSVKWFGAQSDYKYDGTTVSPTDNYLPFTKAYTSLKDRYNGGSTYYLNKARLYIPGGTDASYYYYISNTLIISAEMEVAGDGWNQSILKFPNGVVGIWVRYPDTVGLTYKGGTDVRIQDLALYGSANGVTDDTSHGIVVNSNFTVIEKVAINGFKGDGLNIYGSVPNSNANNSTFNYVRVWNNSRHGIFVSGPDGNQCIFDHCDAISNGEIGFKDSSFLGNDWRSCHSADNGITNPYNRIAVTHGGHQYISIQANTNIEPGVTSGWANYWINADGLSIIATAWSSATAYKANAGYAFTDLNQRGTVYFCYAEGGQWGLINNSNNIFLGGTVAQHSSAHQNFTSVQGVAATNGLLIRDISTVDPVHGYLGGGNDTTQERFIGFFPSAVNHHIGFRYNPAKKAMVFVSEISTFGAPYFFSVYTPAAEQVRTEAVGNTMGFINPILYYNESNGLYNILGIRNTAPTTGTYEVGDIFLYGGTSTTTILFRCVVAGTPGTWQTLSTGGGGGGTPSLNQYQVGVGDASNLLSGSGDLTWNGQTLKLNHATAPQRAIYIGGALVFQDEYSTTLLSRWSQSAGKYIFKNYADGKLVIDPDSTTYASGSIALQLTYGRAEFPSVQVGNSGLGSGSIRFVNSTDPNNFIECTGTSLDFYFQNVLECAINANGLRLVASKYLNWGATAGSSGYGIRDNAGVIEKKDSGGSWAPIGSGTGGVDTLNVQYTDVANSGTSETDLMSYSIPGGTLATDGDRIQFRMAFDFASNTNSKTIKLYVGGTNYGMPANTHSAGGPSILDGEIIRSSSSAIKINYRFTPFGGTGSTGSTSVGSISFAGTIVLKSTGTSGTASNDITQNSMSVTYYPI